MGKTEPAESSGRVLSATFLERHTSKNDLLRRLRAVVEALSDEDVEPNTPDYPGLDGLAALLVNDRFLNHRDKEVRLHTVLACMEIFYLYAPEPPWDETEILRVFSQMIRQLANLAHCTSPSQANFQHYFHLLEKLSVVKIGVVLVELTRTLDSDASPSGADGADRTSSEEALEMLAELIRTILQCVHIDHPPEVANHAVAAISACIEEFDGTLPIPILDEILVCVSGGPVVFVTNPAAVDAAAKLAAAKKRGEKTDDTMPPAQIQQTNPSYMVAAAVIRRTVDRISTPIANFLNGLLNGDTNIITQTNISSDENPPVSASAAQFSAPEKHATADIWTIIYELHRISPQILTTVIGNVTLSLESPNLQKRLRVTKLLGRLFYAPTSKIGLQFSPCYREWIRRSSDIDSKVRLAMVKYLITILANKGDEKELAKEASNALVNMMEHDPNLDVRLQAIHQVCDLAYKAKDTSSAKASVPARLLHAVGSRVSSKNKLERRDALTGLAQIYYRHYVWEKLKQVQSGGDDCDIGVILETLHDTCHSDAYKREISKKRRGRAADDDDHESLDVDDKYNWIPRKVFESACFTDSTDPEMRNRVVQIVDDVLLGSGGSSDGDKGKKETLTPTSRAVGLTFVVDSLRDDGDDLHGGSTSNAFQWMCALFTQRANLQRALGKYIDSRTKLKECKPGTEEALTAEAEAMERLEILATLTAPVLPSGSSSSPADIRPILEKLHAARDKHIFRILATIASQTHTASARARAFDELPKRTNSLGETTAAWVKSLARRCAMGHFLNMEIVNHCIMLAQECYHEDDIQACLLFLSCVKMAVEIYPALCGNREGFGTLIELFGECREGTSGKKRKEIEGSGLVTVLSSILAVAAPARATVPNLQKSKDRQSPESDLQLQLLHLCTRDGTPEQARHAVYTMAALFNPVPVSVNGSSSNESLWFQRHIDAFHPLLKALTSPTRLTLRSGDADNKKVVSVLAALAALTECAPALFGNDVSIVGRGGEKAVRFALEICLLGRHDLIHHDSDDEPVESNEEMESDSADSIKSKRRQSRKSGASTYHMTPDGGTSALEDETLSLACRRTCASIDFLASHVRYTLMALSKSSGGTPGSILRPSDDHVCQIFGILISILRDNGLPPSSRDRRDCKARQDRAALRHCASVNLLRMCDARLKLEKTFLTVAMWHTLASVCLDEEKLVRDAFLEELSMMFTGQGKFGQDHSKGSAFAPSLRFVAMVTLCTDLDQSLSHSGANGNAAIVGKRTVSTKNAAQQCITSLRKTSDATLAQCRALGREAELKFENSLKMMLMPEYAVPYALHLLSFRRETPSAGGTTGSGLTQLSSSQVGDTDEANIVDEEIQHKVLRKRLRWLFEPLVLSLGDGADNISFLLRMTEVLGNYYQPKHISPNVNKTVLPFSPDSVSPANKDREIHGSSEELYDAKSAAKLKTICAAAREVLLSFVKKDVNLTPYPGAIQLPGSLFTRSRSKEITSSKNITTEMDAFSHSSGSGGDESLVDTLVEGRERLTTSITSQEQRHVWESISLEPNSSTRDSLDSIKSISSKVDRGSLGSAYSTRSTRSKSRVHFSPDLEAGKRGSKRGVNDDGYGFSGVSQIGRLSRQPRGSTGAMVDSESDDEDTTSHTPLSVESNPPEVEYVASSPAEKRKSAKRIPGKASRPRGQSSKSLTPIQIQAARQGPVHEKFESDLTGEENMTSSPTEKLKSAKRAILGRAKRPRGQSSKSLTPVQIQETSQSPVHEKYESDPTGEEKTTSSPTDKRKSAKEAIPGKGKRPRGQSSKSSAPIKIQVARQSPVHEKFESDPTVDEKTTTSSPTGKRKSAKQAIPGKGKRPRGQSSKSSDPIKIQVARQSPVHEKFESDPTADENTTSSPTEKRKSAKQAIAGKGKRPRGQSSKSLAPIKIQVARQSPVHEKPPDLRQNGKSDAIARTAGRKRTIIAKQSRKRNDEFDFPDDDVQKENVEDRQSSRLKSNTASKKVKSPASKSLRGSRRRA